jgi:transcriptional regulator CtsR
MDQEVSSQFFRDLMESAQEAVEIHQGKRLQLVERFTCKPSHQISY